MDIIKKILPFKKSKICCVGQTAIVMGILENYETDRMKTWFVNSMINMRTWFLPNAITIGFDIEFGDNEFKNCPLLEQYFIPIKMVRNYDLDITTVAMNMIDEDRYLGFLCDRYYLSFCKYNYMNKHLSHFALIYGYDKSSQTFCMADYFNNKYSFEKVTFDELRDAFTSPYCKSEQPFEDSIISVKYKENLHHIIVYKPERLIYLIQQYLAGEKFPKENVWYGISMYEALKTLILNKVYLYSPIQAIYDHAIVFRRRIAYMQDLGIMEFSADEITLFDHLENQSLTLRNLILKHQLLETPKSLDKITAKIEQVKELDIQCNQLLLHRLS